MSGWRWLRWRVSLMAVLLLLAAAVPTASVVLPRVHRWRMAHQLVADDAADREVALRYLAQHADTDPELVQTALQRMTEADDAVFEQLAQTLDMVGHWSRATVPPSLWLRRLVLRSADPSADVRAGVADELAAWSDLAHEPRFLDTMRQLAGDESPLVRRATLRTAALLLRGTTNRRDYQALIAGFRDDADPQVARFAWITLGLLDPAGGYRANWRTTPPMVSEAILWAVSRTNPMHPQPALDALAATQGSARLRAAAVYSLTQSGEAAAQQKLVELMRRPPGNPTSDALVLAWRAILGIRSADRLPSWVHELATQKHVEAERLPLVCAAHYRLRTLPPVGADHAALRTLAAVEGAIAAGHALILPADVEPSFSDMLAATLLEAADSPSATDDRWVALLTSDDPTVRDLAYVQIARRLKGDRIDALIDGQLRADSHLARINAATLAGLTGRRSAALRTTAGRETVWPVQTIMRLALWAQGELPELEPQVPTLLRMPQTPRSTALLLTLTKRPELALDALLNGEKSPHIDLQDFLIAQRWWRVLQTQLPRDAPPLWMWADRSLQAFQLDVLRVWYWLNRNQIKPSSLK